VVRKRVRAWNGIVDAIQAAQERNYRQILSVLDVGSEVGEIHTGLGEECQRDKVCSIMTGSERQQSARTNVHQDINARSRLGILCASNNNYHLINRQLTITMYSFG
jgi:hypothetical protein